MIIISRCPYRISLLGGGSDLNWFLDKYEYGLSIGLSIPIYSRVVLSYRNENVSNGILNYSSREEYSDVNSICHPIIRNCLKILDIKRPIEFASFGEPLSGSGLGSSSSFTVALLKGLLALNNKKLSNEEIADLACQIEIEKMKKPIGMQDQYLCALGGINILRFQKNEKVIIKNSEKIIDAVNKFMENTFLIYTGISRSATNVLEKVKSNSNSYENIEQIYKIANNFLKEVKNEPNTIVEKLEESVIKSWSLKRNIDGTMNEKLLEIESLLENRNFQILKLLGAGGGGYFLVKYNGNNFQIDKNFLLTKGFSIKNVGISSTGCEYWKI